MDGEKDDNMPVSEQPSKHIVIVSGDGKDLDISKVYNHLNIEESNENKPEKDRIVIPPEKKQ